MSQTDNFRRQHDDLLELTTSISAFLTPERAEGEAVEVRQVLSQLAGKLQMHLIMESNNLYVLADKM